MSNRTAKFVSAIFASFVASAPLATISQGATPTADDCLAGPKDQTPQGGHWYYRIDHATKRHCWYLKDERENLSQIAPPNSSPSARPTSPPAEAAVPPSVANAHAELAAPPPVGQDTRLAARSPVASPAANAQGSENNPPADAADASPQQSVVAWRWPEPSAVNSSVAEAPTTGGAPVPTNPVAAPRPEIAAVTLAAADSLSGTSESPSGPIRMLLLVMIGVLSLAGILAGTIFGFVNKRRTGGRGIRADRGAIWDSAGSDLQSSPAPSNIGPRRRGADIPRGRTAEDPDDRIAEMLARLSRSPTS